MGSTWPRAAPIPQAKHCRHRHVHLFAKSLHDHFTKVRGFGSDRVLLLTQCFVDDGNMKSVIRPMVSEYSTLIRRFVWSYIIGYGVRIGI